MHGYEMGKEIEGRSSGYFSFAHSTLYPVLHKLEKKGLIRGEWQQSDNERPRKYYALTAAGSATTRTTGSSGETSSWP